jgi:hypothetical protein
MRLLLRLSMIATAAALAPSLKTLPRPVSRTPNRPPATMSQTQKSNKSKLQTIVKDKIEEDTKTKEDLNIEEPWRLLAVYKSNVAAHLRPRPNHDLHAIDATPARRRGGAVL